ncbi:MAG: hypothetical protein KDI38_08105, partial [Calditrichaeota bacterium]|nr:hypothetical protein [Calditrichota bacterium]
MRQIFLTFLLLAVPLAAQKDSPSAADNQRKLQQIRREIADLQTQLEKSASSLKSYLADLKIIDQQTSLQQEALRVLRGEIERNKHEIVSLTGQIATLENQIASLKAIFKKQILFSYKYQRGSELEWILGAENMNQALLRYRYFQTISENVRRIYQRLQEKHQTLNALQDKRGRELVRQESLAGEKLSEQNALQEKKVQREAYVKRVSANQSLLESALREKQESYEKLKGLIGNLERDKGQRVLEPQQQIEWDKIKGNFAAQKRKLNWPVRGKVVHPFGKYKNPRLKTVLLNNGIDIAAEKGTEVSCVFSGVVSVITYM